MTWWNSVDPAAVTVDAGGRATVRFRVRHSSNTATHIEEYQVSVGLPATGTADRATLCAHVGGSVNNPGVAGR